MTNDLTVVVPTWNRATEIRALVEDLLGSQTDPRFELLVVDDGSSDDTQARLAELSDPRFRMIAAEHAGVSTARNRGAAGACGEWLVFLDSDDVPDPGWVGAFRALCAPDVDLAFVGQRRCESDGAMSTHVPEVAGPAFGSLESLWQAGAFAIRRTLFDAVGGYRDGLAFSENTDLGLRIAKHHEQCAVRVAVDPAPRYTVHRREGRYDPVVQLESAESMLRSNAAQLALEPKLHASYEAIAGVAAHKLGLRVRARSHLHSAIRLRPLDLRHHARLARTLVG